MHEVANLFSEISQEGSLDISEYIKQKSSILNLTTKAIVISKKTTKWSCRFFIDVSEFAKQSSIIHDCLINHAHSLTNQTKALSSITTEDKLLFKTNEKIVSFDIILLNLLNSTYGTIKLIKNKEISFIVLDALYSFSFKPHREKHLFECMSYLSLGFLHYNKQQVTIEDFYTADKHRSILATNLSQTKIQIV